MEEQQDGFKVEKIPENTPVLVGFGKHSLQEVMSWIGTEKEIDAYVAQLRAEMGAGNVEVRQQPAEREVKIKAEPNFGINAANVTDTGEELVGTA